MCTSMTDAVLVVVVVVAVVVVAVVVVIRQGKHHGDEWKKMKSRFESVFLDHGVAARATLCGYCVAAPSSQHCQQHSAVISQPCGFRPPMDPH
eukprot:m.158239 g.158239  ORF g.158239 m.158239 type:complete len:93 (-) comp52982_c0_seq6:210-488(-)